MNNIYHLGCGAVGKVDPYNVKKYDDNKFHLKECESYIQNNLQYIAGTYIYEPEKHINVCLPKTDLLGKDCRENYDNKHGFYGFVNLNTIPHLNNCAINQTVNK